MREVSQWEWVMMMVVVVKVVMMYIIGEQNLCWFHSQTRILRTTQSR